MSILFALVGGVLVLLILLDTFEAVVLPRRVSRPYRPTRLYYHLAWRACVALGRRVSAGRLRNALLGAFGPFSLFGLFGVWAAGLIVGFGLLHHALAPSSRSIAESFYLSGATF